eukprot:1542373-Heterocapsa_arctica.AAC.1
MFPFCNSVGSDKHGALWHLSKFEAYFQARTDLLYLQENDIRASLLHDIKKSEESDVVNLSRAATKAATFIQTHGGRFHDFIDRYLSLCINIYAFTIGILVLMDELDRIQTEGIHARRYGSPWNLSQDCNTTTRQRRAVEWGERQAVVKGSPCSRKGGWLGTTRQHVVPGGTHA